MGIITISEIAALAGVSVATVSRVINNSKTVSEKTRKHVISVMKENNYAPNLLGRHLRTQKTNIVLVILTSVSNYFCNRVVNGIDEEARRNGYHTLICMTNDDPEIEGSYINMLRTGLADGAIIMSSTMSQKEMNRLAHEYNVIQCSEYVDENSPYVTIDNEKAAYDAVTHLFDIGRKKIAYCGVKNHMISSKARFDGYVKALYAHGLNPDWSIIFDGDYGFRSAYSLTEQHIKSGAEFDGLFSISDRMASGAVSAIHSCGLKVPEDIAVVGFDNTDAAYMTTPPLTTVAQPKKELGQEAMKSLLERFKGNIPDKKILKYELIIRKSTII